MVAKQVMSFEQYITAISAGTFKEISITEVSDDYIYPKVETPDGSNFPIAITRPKYTQQDLPVGTKVYILTNSTDEAENEIFKIREGYILGNYSPLKYGEVRTDVSGMTPTTEILGIAENPESDFMKMRQAIQEFKTAVGKTDKDSDNCQINWAIYDLRRNSEYTPKWLTTKKAKKAYNTLAETLGEELLAKTFYMSWFDYMWLEKMPARIGQE
jgi:hypothetical protein